MSDNILRCQAQKIKNRQHDFWINKESKQLAPDSTGMSYVILYLHAHKTFQKLCEIPFWRTLL